MTKNHLLAMQRQKTVGQSVLSGAGFVSGVVVMMVIMTNPALADLQGGVDKVTNYATTLKTAFLSVGAILAVVYLMWKALECWGGRAEWKEFGLAVLYVALAGSAASLAGWAWTAFN